MDETCGDAEGKAGGGGGVEEDMEVGECSEEEEDEEEDIDLGSSPIADNSSVIMSMTSPAPTAYEGLASPLRVVPGVISGGKPVGIKRGPGRPRGPGSRGGGAGAVRVKKTSNQSSKLKRWKGLLVSGVYPSSNGKTPGENGEEDSTSPVQPSTPVEQKTPIFVDELLFTEQWPGKVCVLCNLTEHSQLGQGKMCRVECTIEELPKEIPKELLMSPPETPPIDATSPRHQVQLYQNRRQKGMSKFRNAHGGGLEPVDELSLVGHTDAPEPSNIVDGGFIYVHEWCASWCAGISRKSDNTFQNVPFAVMAAANRRCYHCSRYGAGGACIVPSCNKHFHTPCAAAAATFQYTKSMLLICSQHIEHVETNRALSDVICYSCNSLGNVGNLVMCSMCGKHHHGACIGNALQPGLRAGWQCADCRICQLCRQSEDTNRMLVCDSCDKAYHPFCVKPAMSSVPKVGWKCKRCRLCSDCGARTPGGGLSSRWHSNYTVCDSCYQQRNKGFSCPVCHKAYRAAALREMVRCSQCQRFVHGTCDKEADFVSYHRKKEAHPDYEYICLSCKNNSTIHFMKRKDSTDDIQFDSNLSVSQDSFMANDDNDGDSEKSDDTSRRFSMVGLGKGKPFYATKIAKKRLGLSSGPGRPKGSGKLPSVTSALSNFQRKHKFSDFGRKRGSKTKIRGMFGVPGLALQSPTWSSSDPAPKSGDDEPGCENKIILCAAKEKFVLGQDVCVMCGALGIDQEACLICCSQCGQCFHPYCVTVKVTKVMLTRGWRCLDCTVCEGCGQRNDEARLILCDDCDISYHIYCMDPPMGSVPTGGWKCKWCAQCLTCGATSPGINSTWQSNFSQCGACASRTTCPACYELYTDGDLIIKCINCDRWLHCLCDTITTEQEAEAYCAQGYTCVMCRPANMPLAPPVTPTRAPSPEFPAEGKANDYYVDGVCLSEVGLQQIKTLELENSNQPVRRKRPGFKRSQENDLLNLDDGENENPNPVYKDGMVWGSKENGPVPSPPEGFSLSTSESGVVILKRKKQRNLQKLGIGGFSAVKMRSSRFKDDEEGLNTFGEDKPRRKPRCTKKRSKLAESYPSYLQEAFFGRELLDITKESTQELESEESEESDNEKPKVDHDKTISLSQDELKVMADATARKEKEELARNSPCISVKEEDMSDSENFKDILQLPDNLLHNDLVNTIMNERDVIKSEIDSGTHESNGDQKDELSEILGPNFSLDSIQTGLPNMDSKDVEEIFKGVLTHESQDAHSTSPLVPRGSTPSTPSQAQVSPQQGLPTTVLSRSGSVTPAVHSNLPSPMGFPSASPYNSEYSNSPQFSPGGDNSPWGGDENANNQRNSLKMEQDEALGQHATIAAVLYANMNHPELKQEFPSWPERFKQVIRKWRQLPNEKRAPYVQLAKENRTNVRIKKTQQIGKEEAEEEGSNGKQTASGKTFEEQEKTTMNKTSREAEQERWKQLQALRQQHQLFAQSRPAVPPRLPRQLSNEGPNLVQYSPENPNTQAPPTQQLLVSTQQEPTAATALGGIGSPRPTQFTTPGGIKTVRQAPPGTVYRTVLRPPGPAASPFSPPRQPAPEEMNRQLRDLLKGQHIKQETVIGENSVLATTSAGGQIRAQLAQVRAAQPMHQANVQGVMDARVRYHLLQQSRPNFPGSPVRLTGPRQQLEQFNALVQRQQFAQAAPNSSASAIVRAPQQQLVVDQSARIQAQLESRLPAAGNNRDGEEIPDSVTAELEKLEQEGGSIAEAEAVSAILGDLVEDDDDALLAEMGADFNILAYADPELDDITDGDKTNLHIPHLDDLEEEMEKRKQSNANEAKPAEVPQAPSEQKPQLPQPKEETPQPNQIVLPNRTPPTSLPVSVVATNNMAPSPPVTQQGTLVNHVLPAAKDKTFTPFVTPNTPLPRMQLMPGGVTSPRAQQAAAPMPGGQNSEFIQISPPPPYPGPPPPYPGQIQSTIRVGGPKVARSALPPLSAAAPRRSLLLQEQPLLLEDLLEEEKREQEQRSGTPVQGPSSGTSLMSDADFEMLRADVLGTTTQVSSPPQISSVPLLNITVQPAPPLPPDNIVTEQDRQMQIQYEQWLHSNNSAVTQQLKYYETEVQKLRKIRKSLNSKQRQLRKNGNQLPPKDAVELQRVQGETTVLQKHLEAARKQSRTHSIVMQEYQNKQDQKNGGIASSVITASVLVPQGMDTSSPQSPNGMPPGMQQQQTMLPSPQTSASPLHHSPRIGTPHSQSGDDKSDNGLASPRPPPMAPTPPSPHQFHQIRHPGMVPRFARSPEGQPRPRLVLQSAQNSAMYSAPRAFVTSPQSPSLSPQNVIPNRLTPQHQQLLIQRHQLQQQKRELLLRQEALQEGLIPRQMQSQEGVGLIPRQLQTQDGVGLIPRQLQTQDGVQRQVLLRQGLIQDESMTPQEQQQQLQALQQRQQQLQQNRQQLIMTQQGKVAQYRQLIQQPSTLIQASQMQSPTNTNQQLISQFASSSPVPPSPMQSPSPISTMSNTPQYSTSSSPLHPPPSPMLSQFQNPSSSPMPQQSPRVQNYQTANSPMTPQSPMVYSGLQTPTSPMPQFNQPNSPMPPHSPRVQQQYGQPPSSPMGSNSQNSMMQQQYVHRPNSPMVPMGSPMPMRRPSSTGGSIASSPAAERPQSVEPRTPQEQDVNSMLGGGGGGGGGNPYLPYNPVPFPPELYRDGYLKMGLKGGSPMWSDKALPRKPLLKGKVGQPSPGTSANNDEKSRKSLVSVDYNDFDEESTPPTTPPVKAASIKKSDGPVKTRQSEDTDSELTVYDDIVLVEGCKEGNLEVEELQSALENNVMSTVVSMPMMIDDPDILDDCLVSSSDLVVLDVDNTNNDNDCILGKDDENILLLDEDISDGLKVDDELMELDEDMPSPPLGRKRISGKVLPGQSIHQEDQKQTSEAADSPDDSSVHTIKERNERVTSSEEEKKSDSARSQDIVDRNVPTSVQPNVVVSSRSSAAFTPISTQKSIPVCSERNLSKQQAAIASLVQDAVNAAKLAAAEAQNSQKPTPTDASNANSSHIFSRPMNILHGSRGPHNQYLSSAVITNKIENQLAGGSELMKKDGKTIKHEPSSPDHSPTKSETRTYQENSIPLEHRNRIMEFLKSDEPTGTCEREPNKNFGLQNKRTNLILKLEENSEGEGGSKLSLRLDNSLRGLDRNAIQKNSSMIFNIVSDKSDGGDKPEFKFGERNKQQNMNESLYNSNRGEQVTLPAVSSSILEAQLTSMLRSSASDPPTSSNQKIIYAIVNHNNKESSQQRENPSPHDEIKVEGLAAHLQRTIKSETEVRMTENDIIRNAKIHQNYKPNLYTQPKIKSDSFIVGGTHYKVYTGTQGENLVVPSEENKMQNHYMNKVIDNNSNNHPQVIVKQEPGLSSFNKPKPTDRFTSSEVLQQRVVSSSELPQMLNDKETHHVSFSGAAKALQKDEPKKFVSLSNMLMPRRDSDDGKGNLRLSRTPDDSQNVLLKQLLQNTACATSTPSPQTPSLPIVPSLEAQLARPVPPTPSSLIPPLLNEPPKPPPAAVKEIPSSPQTPKPPSVPNTPTTPESSRAPSAASCLDELLSPPPQPPTLSSLQGGPVIKREPMTSSVPPQGQGSTSPMTSPMEIKKEVVPVNVPVAVEVKKEVVSSDEMLSPGLRMEPETPGDPSQDLKKQKRRIYQQKRRQSLGKESTGGTPKKRPRKSSKVEEDYDSFIDSLMLQLRQIPTTMAICEPNLTYNFTGSPVFGSGDLSKVNSCTRLGELRGTYGNAYLPHENDYYNTIPFGDLPPKAPSAPSTQRGFYNEEFAPLKLHATKDEFDDRKYDYNRDTNDTPDTIVSSSSPECIMPEFPTRYPGLQFIDSDSEDEKLKPSRFSPDIPIISPLVVRPKPIRFYSDMDKENEGPQGKKHCDNVTVTLTLNSQAADDVLSVLRNLANVLRIPVPVHYSITERMSKPSHRLGMCKIRSKDGKEGGQVDIQSILNGSTKFCRHCEVVITNNLMRKKASDLPLVAKQGEEELYFCSTACYMQLALAHPAPAHQEKKPSTEVPPFMGTRGAGKRESRTSIDKAVAPPVKKAPSRYRVWTSMTIPPPTSRHKKPTEKEITEMMFKCGIPLAPPKLPEDTRTCLFCHQMGDGVTHGPARLLNYDVNKWVHLNCALWSDEVYETTNGGLVNVEQALQNGSSASCAYCNTTGATLKCYKIRCSVVYHLPCAVKDACVFYKNKTLYCASHVPKNEKENELTTLSVMRRVYVQRDEPRQIASIMHNTEQNNLLRVGSLTFLSVGQLLPHQLQNFHTPNYIYPIGYKILRMYWSMRVANRRCKYVCSIHELEGRPEFRIVVQERGEQDLELRDTTARGVWLKVLEPLAELRRNDTLVKMFSKYITGEDLFGLTEPVVVRVLESLPGIDTLTDYKFKYGKNPFLELPLAINPTGCARSEVRPKGPGVMRKAHTQRTSSVSYRPSQSPSISIPGEPLCPYSKQFVHSKSSQYKKMKQEWRNNVYLARSKIQGLGLYAARDLEKHTMVIEYIGEIIRTEVAETREKQYEAKNRGIYMFRLDEDRVVDATLSGGLARYINHSCYPNCVAETVEVERDLRIIIFTKRRINRGEELAYDYKFDIEDDQHKIPCMCGAPNCRKWMN